MAVGRSSYRVPVQVAVTTALAAGGLAPGPPSAGATPIDDTFFAQAVPPAGMTDFTLGPFATTAFITALGLDTPDAPNTRYSTRVDAADVAPFALETGSPGPTAAPVSLPVPIVVPAGSTFTFRVTDVGGVGYNVNARIQGFR